MYTQAGSRPEQIWPPALLAKFLYSITPPDRRAVSETLPGRSRL